ncbi:MAG: Mov34/MPN/PAD-1 family protein [Pirellulaceae bacterium]
MDDEIRFGELEEVCRGRRMRPDQNRHYAVVPCRTPSPTDLPIFVDVDVLREMELHAASNPEVELGGVLLGGQYEDDQGQPFVVITDSLRAEHFESTKGSFKFTHETWSDISRKRDEFPDDTHMVGWYHTHPGWGIFLSGMDTFICQHFFNKPLDVALVIDPCQQQRGFFQWTTGPERRTRLTQGFYLTGSRFRQPELELYAAQLEGRIFMPTDPRHGGLSGGYPPMVVQVREPKQPWLPLAVLGMLTMQFLVVALIAWRILAPPELTRPASTSDSTDLAAQRAMLDRVIGQLDVAPDGIVQSLEQERQKNDELQSSNLGLLARVRELSDAQEKTAEELQIALERNRDLQAAHDRLASDRQAVRAQVKELRGKLAQYEQGPDEEQGIDTETGMAAWLTRWKWYVGGGLVLLLAIVAGIVAYYGPVRGEDDHEMAPPRNDEGRMTE